jgi:inosine-uridine nucleoside N-ribohydrolase
MSEFNIWADPEAAAIVFDCGAPLTMAGLDVTHQFRAVLALTHPHLFERAARHVVIETSGEHTRGMTVIDQRNLVDRPAPNCDVLESVDPEATFDVIVDAIADATSTRGPADPSDPGVR